MADRKKMPKGMRLGESPPDEILTLLREAYERDSPLRPAVIEVSPRQLDEVMKRIGS